MSATTIRADVEIMTLVNVFTVEPPQQQELVDVLVEATDEVMQTLPGFVSANIHGSLDGRHVVNYAQWRSQEHFAAMRENPAVGPHMARAADLAQFTPIVCGVVHTRQA
jgi:quinol monooxygenase YgiN